MTRSAKLYQGEDLWPVIDYTDSVIWEESEFGTRAWRGEGSASSIVIRDPLGEQGSASNLPAGLTSRSLASKNVFVVDLDGEYMFRGRVGIKNYTRDGQLVERYRQVECQLHDTNWDLDHIFVHGYTRPAETDNARIQGIIASYLSGNPRATTHLNGSNFLSGSNTVALATQTFTRTTPLEMIRETAISANKQFFVTGDTLTGGSLFWDGNDSTVYEAGLRISDRPDEITSTSSSPGTATVRLYPSSTRSGSGAGESLAAPNFTASNADSGWLGSVIAGFEYSYMYDAPQSTGAGSAGSWAAVGTGAPGDIGIIGYVHRIDGDLLSIIQNGGVVRGQQQAHSRTGIGVDDGAQFNYSNFSVRVYRPGTATFVAQLVDVGDLVGSVRFAQSPTAFNSAWGAYTFAAFAGAQDGDYLVIDVGLHHVAPLSGAAGATLYQSDTGGSDLPFGDHNAGLSQNSWWQLGPAEESLPTFPPIWDVGPASTEDGAEQVSEVVLFYGAGGDQYVIAENETVSTQYAHSSQVFTDDADIDASTALVRARTILAHRQYEDKTYNVSIGPLTDDQVLLVKHGQTIDIKARAIPDADDAFRTMRIVQCRYTTPVPETWFAHLQLGRPWKMQPYGTGPVLTPKSGSSSGTTPGTVGATGDAGEDNGEFANSDHSHGHGNIISGGPYHMAEDVTVADSGGYFTSGQVEGALQEIGLELDGLSGSGSVGLVPHAGPMGWSTQISSTGNYGLAAVVAGNGGALAVPILIGAPMVGQGLALVQGDTSLARTAEFRLYLDNGDSTADFVTGTNGTLSFTPTALSIERGAFASAPVTLTPGQYWAVIRCTGGSNQLSVRRGSGAVNAYACQTAVIAALGSSIELVTGWTTQISVPHIWVEGRVLGKTTALT